MSNQIIDPVLNDNNSSNMDPIVAIQYQQRSLIALNFYQDLTIIELYTIAKNETEKYIEASKSQLNASTTICSTSENQLN